MLAKFGSDGGVGDTEAGTDPRQRFPLFIELGAFPCLFGGQALATNGDTLVAEDGGNSGLEMPKLLPTRRVVSPAS